MIWMMKDSVKKVMDWILYSKLNIVSRFLVKDILNFVYVCKRYGCKFYLMCFKIKYVSILFKIYIIMGM